MCTTHRNTVGTTHRNREQVEGTFAARGVEQNQEWTRNQLFADEYVRERAVEDRKISNRRLVLKDTLAKMNSCLEKISCIV